MCARLIGNDIGCESSLHKLRMNFCGITDQAHADRLAPLFRAHQNFQRFVEMIRDLIAIAAVNSFLDARLIDLDSKKGCAGHLRREGLRATHATESGSKHDLARQRSIEMLFGARSERLKCPL